MTDRTESEHTGTRILCVDDEEAVLLLLKKFIARQGHEAVTARDGVEAFAAMQREAFPLVLTDLTMPRMDGMELMRHIRNHYPQTSVIVISAIAAEYSLSDLIAAGATDFIQKPFSADEFIAKLNRVLREQRAFAALSAEVEERRRAEVELHYREEQYRSLVENIGIGVALISPAMEILTMNRQMQEWFPDVDASRRPFCYQAFKVSGGKTCAFCPVVATLADGGRHEAFVELPGEGGTRYLHLIASPIKDEQGQVVNVIKVMEDYSERKQAEVALQEKQAQLIHAGRLTALGEMATAMAHEINQPLNVISITLQTWDLLQQRGRLAPGTMLEEAKKLQSNVERISRIIDHVRSFGRIQQDLLPVSLSQVAQEALNLCRMQFKNHGILLEEACQEKVPPAPAVSAELEQVALNLLSNARAAVETRFGPQGASKCRVRISAAATPQRITLTVEDNGGGIKEEHLPRIFDPFFTTKPVGKGTGLGLSISRQIMEKFGGGLECINHPGEGAAFTAWLPVAEG